MQHCEKPRNCLCIGIASQKLEAVNHPKSKYTPEDWDFNNKIKFQISNDQQKLADRVLEDSKKTVGESNDITTTNKKEVDYQLRERATQIRFIVDELKLQKKTALIEEDNLKTCKFRIQNGKNFLKEKSLMICNKCLILREGRLSSDLVDDEVNRELVREAKMIKGCQCLLDKVLNENIEQIRRLKATIYLLDRDLSNKDKSLKIDETNLSLRENQNHLQTYHGNIPLAKCDYTLPEWTAKTYNNIENTAKELNSTAQLRSYINIILKQIVEDLSNQRDRTNNAFETRICEVQFIKKSLEDTHNDTIMRINQIKHNLTYIEDEIRKNEGYLALCQMRLGNRAQRPGLEATCDTVHDSLVRELCDLKNTLARLNQKHAENKATLRYLLNSQVMQEEEINIKTNSLKIDEADCMGIRTALHYQSF